MASETDKKSTPLPLLRTDIRILAGGLTSSGDKTWLIFDPVSDKYYRIGQEEYEVISRFQEGKSVEQLNSEMAVVSNRYNPAGINKIIRFLKLNHLCVPVYENTMKTLLEEQDNRRKAYFVRLLGSYLSIKIPLWKPDRFLTWTAPLVSMIFNRWIMMLLIVASCWGYLQIFPNWTRLKVSFIGSLTPFGVLNYLIAIVIIKCIHEFAHAYTAKLSGVRAREFGFAIIIFMPRLYTDLTDSWLLTDRRSRILIDGAGIFIELIIGGLAALIWAETGAGTIHSIAYFLFTVSIINTILFNGNPLMRFDGYYLLSDIINIDNLQSKAIKQIKLYQRRFFWGIPTPASAKEPRSYLLLIYGISAFFYRIFLYTSIIALIYYKFTKAVGIFLAVAEVWLLLVMPVIRELRAVRIMKKKSFGFYLRTAFYLIVIAGLLFFTPIPFKLALPCETKAANRSILYVQSAGFLDKVYGENGEDVTNGKLLVSLDNPFLTIEQNEKTLEKEIFQEELDQILSYSKTYQKKEIKQKQLKSITTVLSEIERKKSLLNIYTPISGRFVLYDQDLKPGKWLETGYAFGEIYNPKEVLIYAYVKEENLKNLRKGDGIEVYLENDLEPIHGKITEVHSAPINYMQATPLQDRWGGPLKGTVENHSWTSRDVLYLVIIKPDSKVGPYVIGRSGIANYKRYISIGTVIIRKVMNFLQSELVF